MFKINSERTFKREVTVFIPNNEGKHTKGTFSATYRLLPQDELDKILTGDLEDEDSGFLDEILVAVEGIADQDGNELSNSEALAGVKNDVCARVALVKEYFEAIQKKQSRRKN